jgi:DNA-binding transcriptional ArsR family regulator
MTDPKKSFADVMREDRRLLILRLLDQSTGFTASEYVLSPAMQQLGHMISSDVLRADLAWLAEQGLVEVSEVQGVHIANARQRGLEAARGLTTVPGVKRPVPGA